MLFKVPGYLPYLNVLMGRVELSPYYIAKVKEEPLDN
jgi:hypothetical protein